MSTDLAGVSAEVLSGSPGDMDVSSVSAEVLSGSSAAMDVSSVSAEVLSGSAGSVSVYGISAEVLSGDLVNFFGISSVSVEVLSGDLPDPTSAANKRPSKISVITGEEIKGSGPQGQEYTGQTFRLTWAGRSYEWDGLRLPITESLDIWSGSPSDRSISLSITIPDSVPALLSQGNRLTDAVGQLFDSSGRLLLAGALEAPTWRESDRSIAFTIRESVGKDRSLFPPNYEANLIVIDEDATQVIRDRAINLITDAYSTIGLSPLISAEGDSIKIPGVSPITLPVEYTSTAVGRTYPFVFGRPGAPSGDGSITLRWYKGSEALYIDTVDHLLLIAGHPVAATSVQIWGRGAFTISGSTTITDDYTSEGHDVIQYQDQTGRIVSVVDISATSQAHWLTTSSEELERLRFFVSWSYGDGLSGKAGDVIESLLATTTIRVDWDRVRQAKEQLNKFELAVVIDEPTPVFDWLTQQLAPLGVSWVSGVDGLYPWIYDPESGITHKLTQSRGVCLDGPIEYSDMEPVNRVVMRYRYDELQADFTRTVSPSAVQAGMSRGLYGESAIAIDAEVIQDDEIANLAAMRKLTIFSSIPYIVPVTIPRGEYDLSVGDICSLTLDDVGLIARRVLVSEITTDGGPFLSVTLTVFNDTIAEPHTP